MIYVFDSDALIVLFRNYYPMRFPSLWKKFEEYITEGKIVSVREVYNEIEGYSDRLGEWAKENRDFFNYLLQKNLPLSLKYLKFPIFNLLFVKRSVYRENPSPIPL